MRTEHPAHEDVHEGPEFCAGKNLKNHKVPAINSWEKAVKYLKMLGKSSKVPEYSWTLIHPLIHHLIVKETMAMTGGAPRMAGLVSSWWEVSTN